MIKSFPIGVNEPEYLPDKHFKKLEDAIKYLDELKEKYSYVEENITEKKKELNKAKIVDKKEHQLLQNLPENIFPILNDDAKLLGFQVKNQYDNNNQLLPDKEFTDNTNKWNKDHAERYIDTIKHIKDNNLHIYENNWKYVEPNKREKTNDSNFYIPKYMVP